MKHWRGLFFLIANYKYSGISANISYNKIVTYPLIYEENKNEKEKIIRSGLISDAVFQLTDSVCCRWIGTDPG